MIKDIFQFSIKHIKVQIVLVFEHIKFTVLIWYTYDEFWVYYNVF